MSSIPSDESSKSGVGAFAGTNWPPKPHFGVQTGKRLSANPRRAENPDTSYGDAGDGQFGWQMGIPLRKLVKSYSGRFDIIQGEVGCPSQLEFAPRAALTVRRGFWYHTRRLVLCIET